MIACAKCKFKCKSELVSQLQIPEYEDTLSIDNGLITKVQVRRKTRALAHKYQGYNSMKVYVFCVDLVLPFRGFFGSNTIDVLAIS